MIVTVKFYKDVKKYIPVTGYRPHFIVNGTTQYLGIRFTDLPKTELGLETMAEVELVYDRVDYSSLQVNTTFKIKEGPITVGEGVVIEV